MGIVRKILAGILGFLAAMCLLIAFMNIGDTDRTKDFARVTGGEFVAANDGKPVIVTGVMRVVKPVVDPELKLTIVGSPRVGRRTQVFTRGYDSKKDKNVYEWMPNADDSKYYIAEVTVGEYQIAPDLLENLILGENYTKFYEGELRRAGLVAVKYDTNANGMFVSQVPKVYAGSENTYMNETFFQRLFQTNDREKYLGKKRYVFSVSKLKDGDTVTVLGKQVGKSIALEDSVALNPIRQGSLNDEEIKAELKKDNTSIMIGAVFLTLVFGGLAWWCWPKKKAE